MNNYEQIKSSIDNMNSIYKKEYTVNLFEIGRSILDIIEIVNNEQGEQGEYYIDTFTIKTIDNGILLTLWEREFPIYINLEARRVEYNSDFDECDIWTMDGAYFSVIGFIMQYINNALRLGDSYND